jgi:hypothetical protein
MRACLVPGCERTATRGDEWSAEDAVEPLVSYRLGIELRLGVADIAVRLSLCEPHADELTGAAWQTVEAKLGAWGWKPLGR